MPPGPACPCRLTPRTTRRAAKAHRSATGSTATASSTPSARSAAAAREPEQRLALLQAREHDVGPPAPVLAGEEEAGRGDRPRRLSPGPRFGGRCHMVPARLDQYQRRRGVVLWRGLVERQRREVLGARLLGVQGIIERDGDVVHLVAHRLADHTPLLGRLATASRDFH